MGNNQTKGAICDHCKQDMLAVDGCSYRYAKKTKRSKLVLRDVCKDDRCGDCGAIYGMPHHPGCDMERCPFCHFQAIGCDCGKYYLVEIKQNLA